MLRKSVSFLDSTQYDSYKSLVDIWDKNSFILKLSASAKETDKIEDMILVIGAQYKSSEFFGFEQNKSLLINYINTIFYHENINLETIL